MCRVCRPIRRRRGFGARSTKRRLGAISATHAAFATLSNRARRCDSHELVNGANSTAVRRNVPPRPRCFSYSRHAGRGRAAVNSCPFVKQATSATDDLSRGQRSLRFISDDPHQQRSWVGLLHDCQRVDRDDALERAKRKCRLRMADAFDPVQLFAQKTFEVGGVGDGYLDEIIIFAGH